ncbi:two-component sensor kinase [Candidatus Magnetoovum chiemensis]|nr:two-component sensor kinase [Candidatus Magnetoovum chiemensis]
MHYKILIVDDNYNNRFTLIELLKSIDGCDIIEAESGEEALLTTIEQEIHLILLDVQMPGMNGFETAKHLQMTEKTKDIPIIFVTAIFRSDEFTKHGYELGAVDYLTKPIDINLLLNRVKLYKTLFLREENLKQAIKEIKNKEAIMVHQSKMAALGEMIGLIAHQWRQPLNILSSLLIDLKDVYNCGSLDKEYFANSIKMAMDQMKHMSGTINDFRDFFLPDKEKERFDIKTAIEEALSLFSAQLISNRINYNVICDDYEITNNDLSAITSNEDYKIISYKSEFKHVMLNLISNSKDAIAAAQERIDIDKKQEWFICFEFYTKDNRIIIKIKDNGGGIFDAIKGKIFEPYTTTKTVKDGTGIGLYMSKLIIENNMQGKIYAENSDVGAVFTIELPKSI